MAGTFAITAMSVINIISINSSISEIRSESIETAETPTFTLSKTGKNVIMIMLDRAQGIYVPYMLQENSELAKQFAGFTYYANTTSFGSNTKIASPALYGGYEYTPYQIQLKSSEKLVDKQNEALMVMPVNFDNNDYNVTVCDPSYANYQWIPDLSIYDDYPDIKTYHMSGMFTSAEEKEKVITNNKRNFFCYSIMKIMPVALQESLYNSGSYNVSDNYSAEVMTSPQEITGTSTATGVNTDFMDAYNVLTNLSNITFATEENENNFIMFSNDTAHADMLVDEADEYTPSNNVDNTEYDAANESRFTVNGTSLIMDDGKDYGSYEVNMSAFIQIGKWLDYLRELGVYDNTRIILCSDHGFPYAEDENLVMSDDTEFDDAQVYYPVLMVKDFNSTEFTVSDEFMTNADVPTLTMEGVISNPVNPSTGNAINSDAKNDEPIYVLGTDEWTTDSENEYTFLPARWYTVHDDMRDKNNWTRLQTNSSSPIEETN